MKRFNSIINILDTGVITSTVITGVVSIATFAKGIDLPVGTALRTSILFSLAIAITQNSFEMFTVKQEKHDATKPFSQSNLDGTADIILYATQDGVISSIEFYNVLQEVAKYRRLMADIRNQAKTKVRQITKEQQE